MKNPPPRRSRRALTSYNTGRANSDLTRILKPAIVIPASQEAPPAIESNLQAYDLPTINLPGVSLQERAC